MKSAILGNLLFLLPKNLLSRIVGRLVELRLPKPLGPACIRAFARYYKINVAEAEKPIEAYPSIAAFFTRRLKPGCRPVGEGFVHPADSELTSRGYIHKGQLIQAKGRSYPLGAFLGVEDQSLIESFEEGAYLTYYLCPRDYHRVHAPLGGKVVSAQHIPGELWPVNHWSVNAISQLFAVNERMVIWMETEWGQMALVMVGATNVGKMSLSFDSELISNQHGVDESRIREYQPPVAIKKADELGTFHMGSTVIIATSREFRRNLEGSTGSSVLDQLKGGVVKMGESLYVPIEPEREPPETGREP